MESVDYAGDGAAGVKPDGERDGTLRTLRGGGDDIAAVGNGEDLAHAVDESHVLHGARLPAAGDGRHGLVPERLDALRDGRGEGRERGAEYEVKNKEYKKDQQGSPYIKVLENFFHD